MNDECDVEVEEIVTNFLFETCRLRPQFSRPAAQAAVTCVKVVTIKFPVNHGKNDLIPLTTGSAAEFYIEPMLPHIGDVDVMFHRGTQLAIPRGHQPPTQLPDEFHNSVKVYEIIDSHLPGYVYLGLRYLLTECVDEDKYNAVRYMVSFPLPHFFSFSDTNNIHGPAFLEHQPGSQKPLDAVYCVRCLVWPPQAADWPTRHRNYGWPDSETVDRVVSNGCDLVGVAHRQCRQHEWMGEHQWRLSFSRAEIVLLNSWLPVQQIAYHMLRVFMKTERLTDSADNSEAGTLSNYHIKTLMLWVCELKSGRWRSDHLNLVAVCVQLLYILADWLTDARCQHYFINNCNLFGNSYNMTNIADQLMSIDETSLSTWILDTYIRKCSQLCPDHISLLFDDISTTMKLYNAVSEVAVWRRNNRPLDMWCALNITEYQILLIIHLESLTTRSCACWMTALVKMDPCLSVYFTALAFLHIAYKSLRHGLNNELMDTLATLLGQFICRHGSNLSSSLSLDKAVRLMKVAANKSLSTMSLIEIELSKAYLYRSLRYEDSDSDSIYCLANVYLVVLYYSTGQYQTAMDHCRLVARSQDHSQCSSHVVQGELLPKIDDDIDNVLGLAVFYQYVRTAALNQQGQTQHVSVFTTELFACYLHITCLSGTMVSQFTQTSSTNELKQYEICISGAVELLIGDVLLFASINRSIKQKFYHEYSNQTTMNPTEDNASDLAELLQKSAVERLTTFRQLVARDFGSVATIVTTDFEALYAYKRGEYQKCLQLSTRNVQVLSYAYQMPHVYTFPEFIQLLDDDIVALTALAVIVNPNCRVANNSYACISQLTLSLYLMTQCQLKLRHPVTSLAQTLDYIEVAQRKHEAISILDKLTLKLIERKLVAYIHAFV